MLTISKFLKDIELSEYNRECLEEVCKELDKYLLRLKSYPEEMQKYFLQDYLVKENENSNKIENALYSFDILDLYESGIFDAQRMNKNLIKLLNKLVRSKDKVIAEDQYINYFKDISYEQYLENEKWNLEGNYRRQVVWLGPKNDITKAIHIPPRPEELDDYVKDFFAYCNNKNYEVNDSLKDPLIKAILIHMIFIKIHPFSNGNGRTGRLLLNSYLRLGINKKFNMDFSLPPINLSMSFDMSKKSYIDKQNQIIYKENVDNNAAINSWITYNLYAIEEQLRYLNQRIDKYHDILSYQRSK